MKIKKKDLIELIHEMAYMGIKKTHKGEEDDFSNDTRGNPDKMEKLFTNRKFKKNAQLFFGETKAFPGSNVFIVPFLGYFDWSEGSDLSLKRNDVFQFELFTRGARCQFYDLNTQTMKNILGLNQEEFQNIDEKKDVVLVLNQYYIEKDFNATVHMIFHAFFEGIIELYQYENEGVNKAKISDLLNRTYTAIDYLYNISKPGKFGSQEIQPEIGAIGAIRSNATKYIRKITKGSGEVGTSDFFSEILTSSFLRYSGIKNEIICIDKDSTEWGEVDREKTEKLSNLLRESANEITSFSRGKIIDISIFEGF